LRRRRGDGWPVARHPLLDRLTEVVEMVVPAIIDKDEFEVVQMLRKSRSPAMVAPRVVSGPTLLPASVFAWAAVEL
jgi:hypothetical protein